MDQHFVDNTVLMLKGGRMDPTAEAREAAQIDVVRQRLLDAGADQLARQPWQPSWAPPDDTTLLRFAVRRANAAAGQASHDEIRAALSLIETAREDLDALESALILVARAEGLTWPDIAQGLRVRTPQAAQQRFRRVSERVGAGGAEAVTGGGSGSAAGDKVDDDDEARR